MRFLRDATVTIVLLAFVFWSAAYLRVRAGGLSADAQPGAIERGVAARLIRFSIPAGETWRLVSWIRKMPSLTPEEPEALRKSEYEEAEKPDDHEHTRPDSYRNPR